MGSGVGAVIDGCDDAYQQVLVVSADRKADNDG